MNTTLICPISTHKIDENVARFNAAITLFVLATFLLTQNIFVIVGLSLDFIMRAFYLSHFSPVALLSKYLVSKLKINKNIINAGPKIFAARIALFFNLSILLLDFTNLEYIKLVVTGIFMFCAFLEAAWGYCVACKIYPYLNKFLYRKSIY